MTIQIAMGAEDFDHLAHNRQAWAAYADDSEYKGKAHPGWRTQVAGGRFEALGASVRDPETLPSLHWKWAYWLGVDYTAVIFARSFLTNRGHPCEIVWDLAENPDCSWVILTDYGPEE